MSFFGRDDNFTIRILFYQLFFSNKKVIFKLLCKKLSLTSVEKNLIQCIFFNEGQVAIYVTEKEYLKLLSLERKYEKKLRMDRKHYRDRDVGAPTRKIV